MFGFDGMDATAGGTGKEGEEDSWGFGVGVRSMCYGGIQVSL